MQSFTVYFGFLDRHIPGVAALLVASADAACAVVVMLTGCKLSPWEAEENFTKKLAI